MVMHSLDHISKEDLGGERVAVVDDGLPSWPLPAVKFHTAASLGKSPTIDRQPAQQTVCVPQSRPVDRLASKPRAELQETTPTSVPNVGLGAAGPSDLRVSQVGVV